MYVDQDYLDALVVHPYYKWGYKSVETMVDKLHNNNQPKDYVVRTEPRVVDIRNVEEYRESWKKWLK